MGFFNSLKSKVRGDEHRDDLNPTQQHYDSPEISYDDKTTKREKQQVFGSFPGSRKQDESHSSDQSEQYTAPPGPPPSHSEFQSGSQYYQRQTETTITTEDTSNPPPYESWLSVPDTSQLPPPPAMHSEFSPTNNASEDSAEAGHEWCAQNLMYTPAHPNDTIYNSITTRGDINLQTPPKFRGKNKKEGHKFVSHLSSSSSSSSPTITNLGTTRNPTTTYTITSPRRSTDATFLTTLPLYFAARDNPLLAPSGRGSSQSQQQKTISFAIRILSFSDPDAVVAIGFAARPYPPFRQPGWHRGSLAVHADDGRRYINNPYGGVGFVEPFRPQDLVVLSMVFAPEHSPLAANIAINDGSGTVVSDLPRCRTRVELERNGVAEGGWWVHEERDADLGSDEGVVGLQGEGDLYAAVGVCGDCQVEVIFWPQA